MTGRVYLVPTNGNMNRHIPNNDYLTAWELQELYGRCVDLAEETDNRYVPLYQMWRDKPQHYWKDIFYKKKGNMIPYMKDFNGDQRSAINGNIKGLFFGCGLDRKWKQPPHFSYFGDERLLVNADVLLNFTKKLYFADFYCHYQYHYATLVVTNPGSWQDRFCIANDLLQLNLYNNRLLYLDYNYYGQTLVFVTLGIRVELFVTEGMNLFSLFNKGIGQLVNVQPRGRGHSRKNGIPKKEICNICNLY